MALLSTSDHGKTPGGRQQEVIPPSWRHACVFGLPASCFAQYPCIWIDRKRAQEPLKENGFFGRRWGL